MEDYTETRLNEVDRSVYILRRQLSLYSRLLVSRLAVSQSPDETRTRQHIQSHAKTEVYEWVWAQKNVVVVVVVVVVTVSVPGSYSFLPRCMECSRGIAMGILSVCLSVCLSVKRVHCDKTEESHD